MEEKFKNRKLLILGVFAVVAILIVLTIVAVIRMEKRAAQEAELSREEELWLEEQALKEDPFESTPESPYDTSLEEVLEESKSDIDRRFYKLTTATIRPMIAQARWDEAHEFLRQVFEEFRSTGEYGEKLYRTYEDLNLLVDFADVDPSRYEILFQSFYSPETFLAAMIYYPFSVNHTGYLNPEGLAPNTETNEVAFSEPILETTGTAMQWLERFRPGRYVEAWTQEFTIAGMKFDACYAKDVDGYWHMMEIRSDDESAWWIMTVAEWREALGL